jgi:hypothetical protein
MNITPEVKASLEFIDNSYGKIDKFEKFKPYRETTPELPEQFVLTSLEEVGRTT